MKQGTSNPTADIKKSGPKGESAKVVEVNSHLLRNILVELRITNKILNEVHDLSVNEQDV